MYYLLISLLALQNYRSPGFPVGPKFLKLFRIHVYKANKLILLFGKISNDLQIVIKVPCTSASKMSYTGVFDPLFSNISLKIKSLVHKSWQKPQHLRFFAQK